ncbi:MAG: DUF2490 domain-containing protein [Cytophagales bacterium]
MRNINQISKQSPLVLMIPIFVMGMIFRTNAQVNDAAVWTSIGLKKSISKRTSIDLTQQFRFYENVTELGFFNTEMGVNYKIYKNIVVSPNYRYIHSRRLDNTYAVKHRFFIDLSISKSRKKLGFTYRTRFQSQYSGGITKELGTKPQNVSRNQITIKYKLNKKIAPYIAQDLYFTLNGSKIHQFSTSLSYIGINIKAQKKLNFNFYYLIQAQLNKKNPRRDFVSGASVTYSL